MIFLSSIPVKIKDFDETKLAKSIAYFPLVGLVFGFVLFGLNYILSYFISAAAVNFILIVTLIFMDRGLHLDGLADMADGLLGSKDKDDALRIMKDSSVGAFGVSAIVIVLLGQFIFLNSINPQFKGVALIFMPAIARYGVTYAGFFYKPVKKTGLATSFQKSSGILILATVFMVLIASVIIFEQKQTVIPVLASFAFIPILASLLTKKIGGLTGDIYGAIIEITQMSTLLFFSLLK